MCCRVSWRIAERISNPLTTLWSVSRQMARDAVTEEIGRKKKQGQTP
jgi:hypothetical protein